MSGSAGATDQSRRARLAGFTARALRLTPRELTCLGRALLLLLEVDVRLRLTGFARLEKRLRTSASSGDAAELSNAQLLDAQSMAYALRRASHLLPRARCLHRALAFLLWLRRQGAAAELRMGVRLSPSGIEGHAWVEWHGVPLNEDRSIGGSYLLLQRCQGSARRPPVEPCRRAAKGRAPWS